jgi:Tol biopolymer transport system component
MDADGGNAIPLTDDSAYHHYAFAWSLDGSQIAFIRFDPTQLTQPPELWLIRIDGSEAIKLINGGFSPQWIP